MTVHMGNSDGDTEIFPLTSGGVGFVLRISYWGGKDIAIQK